FSIREFGIAQINEDHTYSSFVLDLDNNKKAHPDFVKITSAKYAVTDPIFSRIINSEDPVIFDINELDGQPAMPAYVDFWKTVGLQQVLGMALRVGGKNIGCVFLHIDTNEKLIRKTRLLTAVFAQLAVAVSNILANEQVNSYKQMLEVENDHLKEQIKTIYNFSDIIGSGPEMQKVYQMMSLVAQSNSTVLLLGETGTGKELIARAIHNSSTRKSKLMIKVNCAALPANLIESELFGHERGSFTGAIDRRIGKFELANHSTLFLDEIGEMPLETQVKLLRVIQERELERVGGTGTIKVNVRIIAASNRNLEEEVNAGRFRPDLYYRLNVFPIILPPLRNRLEDVAPLANYFLERYSRNTGRKVTAISLKAIRELKSYLWPGNVRELEHLIERSILLTQGNILKEIQLPESRNKEENDRLYLSGKTLQEHERAYVIEILKRCSGRIAGGGGAAELLDIPSTTLHSKMKKLAISKEDYFSKQK
ncbi:MAG TPA: sigma 54-interacting transcriptional regulator, partial [Puia sp.]|nr:sigma 54-interacting transcriptional regulator [Puia sp.]